MIKNYDFHCPKCDTHLNQEENIVLKTKRANGDEGVMHLSTSVGNYEYVHHPEVNFEVGELVDFHCTSCNSCLNSEEFQNYTLLKMKVDDQIEFDVLFSRQAGVLKTYLITEDGIETYTGNQ